MVVRLRLGWLLLVTGLMISEKFFCFLCLLRSVSFQDIGFLQELLLLHSGAGVCCTTACGA